MDALGCVLFFSFIFLVFALLGLLVNGIVIVVRMCLRGSALGFALLAAVILPVAGFFHCATYSEKSGVQFAVVAGCRLRVEGRVASDG